LAQTHTVLGEKVNASAPEDFFNQRQSLLASAIPADFDVGDCVSVETGGFCEIPHSPI
jgi:hypothetical protein